MKKLWRSSWWQQNKITESGSVWGKAMKFLLLLSFVAGIFAANFMGREEIVNAGILNDYFVEKFQYTQVNGENLFFYIVGERLPLLFLLLLLMVTSLGIISGMMILAWQGFSVGFMLSTGILKYGAKGILLILGGLFPQYLFYLTVYILYCWITISLRQRFFCGRETAADRKLLYGAFLLTAAVLFLLFMAGIFLESYLSPVILKNILKVF
ncbi:MAG: hypothetical protein HFH41_09650 [Lachnospiraceae bacterium]|nr:hypothetical protein [Lachnospiraceae bacterium]